jgi:hypothetical protein
MFPKRKQMNNEDNMYVGLTYREFISIIPKLSDEMILKLLAFLQLEIKLRNNNNDSRPN